MHVCGVVMEWYLVKMEEDLQRSGRLRLVSGIHAGVEQMQCLTDNIFPRLSNARELEVG